MQYVGYIIRPPSEANSIILQVTVGCSHNKCTFCGAYKDIKFSIKDSQTILQDIVFARENCRNLTRLFLADGDVLSLSQNKLVFIFAQIRRYLPWVKRISLYATAKAIRHKTEADLLELKNLGLDRIYMGVESGCKKILAEVCKRDNPHQMIEAARRLSKVGLFLSVSVLLGLGGVNRSSHHIAKTAEVLTLMQPRQVAALTLMLLPNTPLGQDAMSGMFELPGTNEILQELRQLITGIHCRTQFHANHASTYLPIVGRLPGDKQKMLNLIDRALTGSIPIVAEHRRAL